MALGSPQRDGIHLDDDGVTENRGIVTSHLGYIPNAPTPNTDAALGSHGVPNFYAAINPEIAKSYIINPTNQGQRAGIASRQVMMNDPRNSPSRSQKSEGY